MGANIRLSADIHIWSLFRLQKRNEKTPFKSEQGKLDNIKTVCKLIWQVRWYNCGDLEITQQISWKTLQFIRVV